jgi:hypothetical protein
MVSTQRYSRVLWVVLDGMGFEHARLAVRSNRHAALSRIDKEGWLGSMVPASPACQTPPALLALFTGTQPAQNGVWGYYMPHPERLQDSLSGFYADVERTRTIWQELEERGAGYSLMNVAFRNDPVWKGPAEHLALGLDGYRLWEKPSLFRLSGGPEEISYRGLQLRLRSTRDGAGLSKGSSLRVELPVGEGRYVDITAGTRVFAHLLEPKLLLLNPLNAVVCRGKTAGQSVCGKFLEMSAFHLARRLNSNREPELRVPLEAELLASRVSFQRKTDLMVAQAGNMAARLVVGYFPVIDDFNHAYFDLLQDGDERAAALFHGCVDMVDDLLGRLMQEMDSNTLLVVSSDHGAMAHRSKLHINEILADAGLVRRRAGGYDYARSLAWYHTSDCGQVVAWNMRERGPLLGRLRHALETANAGIGAAIGVLDGDRDWPFLAFLYPKGNMYFTGRPPRVNRPALDKGRAGGHHLSPLSPTPWIQAALGLWTPRQGGVKGSLPFMPKENTEMKRFLMETMELA